MARVVFVQHQVSQVDEPVYARMHALDAESCTVIYWNAYGFFRKQKDPEVGVVPDFSFETVLEYPKTWLDTRITDAAAVIDACLKHRPSLVVLSDIPQRVRLWIASSLRRRSIKVALRSDKNHLSETPHTGARPRC